MKGMYNALSGFFLEDIEGRYREYFEDPVKFNALAIPMYTYNQGVSTKYTVNLVLFMVTVLNLGTDIHKKWKEAIAHG